MGIPLRVLILEDTPTDAELEVYALKRAGFEPDWTRVWSEEDFVAALSPDFDLILADYQLPQFDGARALQIVQERGLQIPFIIVSGAIGEELAVSLMKQGVTDYLQKDRMARLGQAVVRALEQKRDHEEKARAEQALREREASYRELAQRMERQATMFDTLLSSVPDLLYLFDTDHRLTYANRALLELWGKSLDEAVGKTYAELGQPDELVRKLTAEIDDALKGSVVRSELGYTNTAGRSSHYEYYLAPVFDPHGQVVAVAGTSRDITARKETEDLLRNAREAVERQQRWLEMVLDLLPLPIIMVEPGAGRMLFSNKAADRVYGAPIPKEPVDAVATQVFTFTDTAGKPVPAENIPLARAARGERLGGEEAVWHTRAGTFHMNFYSEMLPATYGHAPVAVLLCQDIGHLKGIESSLRESIELLKRERELREMFVSTLSHDLRTPLMAARMSAELLARRAPTHSTVPMLQGRIIENIDRLDGMLQTLLDANLVRAGERLPLQVQPCALRRIVREVIDDLTTVHGDRYRLETTDELEGFWDPHLLRRIIENLLNNAVKYGDPVAPVVVTAEGGYEEVRLHVHNEGEPIDPEIQAVLFEPFRREPARSHEKRGWGIGLTLVRGATESHGGYVTVDSAPGRGTTFTVTLPRDARDLQPGGRHHGGTRVARTGD
ncbi:PAS domain-containing protein [Ectothiorhodospiraceae bacterium 2226]|nr:PAS domain-containing protein [Ectothiorhodospiraceae bacterium 2226]